MRARRPRLEAWLDATGPDVLCLQETRCAPADFPARWFAERGYPHHLVHGGSGHGGVAIVSRLPLERASLGIPGAVDPLDEPRSISATVAGVRLHTAYAPNGRKAGSHAHQVKLAWFVLFGTWLELDGLSHQPTLVMGDLNIAPTDLDVWDAHRYRKRNLTSPPERDAFAALLARGLTDVLRERLGDATAYTWWNRRSDFYETDRGWRLDHVLANGAMVERVQDLWVDRAERGQPGSSDHAPVVVEIDEGV